MHDPLPLSFFLTLKKLGQLIIKTSFQTTDQLILSSLIRKITCTKPFLILELNILNSNLIVNYMICFGVFEKFCF